MGAYFIAGWLVFANCIGTRQRLKAAVELFTLVVAFIVVIALWQYRAAVRGNAFAVGGTFGNRNVLGAFLAVSLPFVFGLALYEKRIWQRFALMLTVALGAMVTLSGGALIALAVALLFVAALKSGNAVLASSRNTGREAFVAALKSQKAVLGVLIAVALAVTVLPDMMALPRHSDVVVSSVVPYIDDNFLDRRQGEPKPHDAPVVAYRYKCWYASVRLIRRGLRPPFLGVGPGRFNEAVGAEYGAVDKPAGATDDVAAFNITAPEPDTFNMYLVTCAETGPFALLALVWLGVLLFGRNVRAHFECGDDFGRGLALGSAGAVVGAALCAIFSSILVRGVAMPFIFAALSGILWSRLPDADSHRLSR